MFHRDIPERLNCLPGRTLNRPNKQATNHSLSHTIPELKLAPSKGKPIKKAMQIVITITNHTKKRKTKKRALITIKNVNLRYNWTRRLCCLHFGDSGQNIVDFFSHSGPLFDVQVDRVTARFYTRTQSDWACLLAVLCERLYIS